MRKIVRQQKIRRQLDRGVSALPGEVHPLLRGLPERDGAVTTDKIPNQNSNEKGTQRIERLQALFHRLQGERAHKRKEI